MRPAGKVLIDKQRIDAVAESGFITETLDFGSTEDRAFATNDPLYQGLLHTVNAAIVTAQAGDFANTPDKIDLTGRERKPDRWQPQWIVEKYFRGS